MDITKKQWVIIGVLAVIIALLGVAYSAKAPATSQTPDEGRSASSTPPTVTTTSVNTTVSTTASTEKTPSTQLFPMNPKDTLSSWDFNGGYTDNATLTAQTIADITKLTGLLGGGKYDDYDLYNGIANDYGLLGNGQEAYQYYNRSIKVHPAKGLAYANLAHLMDQLGAEETATDAYAKAVAVEPGMLEYHIERLTYLTRQFPKDSSRIKSALADVSKQFGDTAPIISLEAQWLSGQNRYADAIKAWQTVKMLSPGKDTTAIDAEIARLQAKQ